MQVQTKSGRLEATLKSTSAITKAPHGSFEAVLSVPSVDRDGEVVDGGAFEPLPDHITIDVDHAMSVEKTIGSGRPFYDGEKLKFEGTYASHPLAQMVRSLVDEGHVKTVSIAYREALYEIDPDDGLPHMRKGELINAGVVAIPANRDALITASKALRDAAESSPPADHPERRAGAKSIVGSFEQRSEILRRTVGEQYAAADYVWVRATFDDSIVFDVEFGSEAHTYQASYEMTDDAVTLGEIAEVTLAEVVLPKSLQANPETKAAAADAAAAEPSPAEVETAKARAVTVAAEAALVS